jgi:hypothetical protein
MTWEMLKRLLDEAKTGLTHETWWLIMSNKFIHHCDLHKGPVLLRVKTISEFWDTGDHCEDHCHLECVVTHCSRHGLVIQRNCGEDSSAVIATHYRMDSLGLLGGIFTACVQPVLGPTQPPVQGVPVYFAGGRVARCVVDHPSLPKNQANKEYLYSTSATKPLAY